MRAGVKFALGTFKTRKKARINCTAHPYRGNIFEAFPKMWLHSRGILGLREYLQKLVIWQEEKARKSASLCLQVLAQTFLNLIYVRKENVSQKKPRRLLFPALRRIYCLLNTKK